MFRIDTVAHLIFTLQNNSAKRNRWILPDGDEVVRPVHLKQGEVDFDAEARSDGDQPGAVSRVGVLLRVTWREDGPIVQRNVPPTRC